MTTAKWDIRGLRDVQFTLPVGYILRANVVGVSIVFEFEPVDKSKKSPGDKPAFLQGQGWTVEDFELFRQWFDYCQDHDKVGYLEKMDFELGARLYLLLGQRVPHTVLEKAGLPVPNAGIVSSVVDGFMKATRAAAQLAPPADLTSEEQQAKRQADRERYPDPAFNNWLDDFVSDGGWTVWDTLKSVDDAWSGWKAYVSEQPFSEAEEKQRLEAAAKTLDYLRYTWEGGSQWMPPYRGARGRFDNLVGAFQDRVQPWLIECFGPTIAGDREERNHRFLEEGLELVQSLDCTREAAHALVDYVFDRPVGEPKQETGGVMVTLAALCLANDIDLHQAAEVELYRISAPETVLKIRAKQAAKPKHSPLPQGPTTTGETP